MTTLRSAFAATLSVLFLSTSPGFASEAQPPAQEDATAQQGETAPAPQQDGHRHHCQGFRAGKNLRAFLTARDDTGTTRLERIAATGAGIGVTALAATAVGAVAVVTAVGPSCVGNVGNCSANLQRQATAPFTAPVSTPAGPAAAPAMTR